jgi:excisionase family DNA binding protein
MTTGRVQTESILLRGAEVAELLAISRAKAYRLMQRREIPVVTFGKSVRVLIESLLNFIRGRTELPVGGVVAE